VTVPYCLRVEAWFPAGMLTEAQRTAALGDYIANTNYEADATGAAAKAYRAACRTLKLDPQSAAAAGRQMTRETLQTEIDQVTAWLRANGLDAAPTQIHALTFGRPG